MRVPPSSLAAIPAEPQLGRMLDELRAGLFRLHGDVRVTETPYELLADFRDTRLCRVVPYRELLHVQVGEDPVWETRVRNAREFPGVMEKIVRVFLRALARSP